LAVATQILKLSQYVQLLQYLFPFAYFVRSDSTTHTDTSLNTTSQRALYIICMSPDILGRRGQSATSILQASSSSCPLLDFAVTYPTRDQQSFDCRRLRTAYTQILITLHKPIFRYSIDYLNFTSWKRFYIVLRGSWDHIFIHLRTNS
jgi:hypothetical protein